MIPWQQNDRNRKVNSKKFLPIFFRPDHTLQKNIAEKLHKKLGCTIFLPEQKRVS